MDTKRSTDRNLAQLWLITSQAGCTMAVLVIGGLVLGIWLDQQLGTRPVFILALMMAGIVLGPVIAIFSVLRATQATDVTAGQTDQPPSADTEP
jgi:F0F1-type ATP synthase assembly protein I